MYDLVTVFHDEATRREAEELKATIRRFEELPDLPFEMIDNTVINRGFARACNLGARRGRNPIVGFLNPDLKVSGSFLPRISDAFGSDELVVIAGPDFGKARGDLDVWGVRSWVCGAAYFVWREFFEEVNGFDEQFVWSWEETDLIRQAEAAGRRVVTIRDLPLSHVSPGNTTPYKRQHFDEGARRFNRKWLGR